MALGLPKINDVKCASDYCALERDSVRVMATKRHEKEYVRSQHGQRAYRRDAEERGGTDVLVIFCGHQSAGIATH
jgi:hypothetical protein